MDDLTNNLKQSSGQGIGAFFPSQPTPQEEKKPIVQVEQSTEPRDQSAVPPLPKPAIIPVEQNKHEKPANQQARKPVKQSSVPSASEASNRPVRYRHAFDIYQDQYESLLDLSLDERRQGGTGSMSAMVREALDQFIAARKKK
jgi:hypothetical protein